MVINKTKEEVERFLEEAKELMLNEDNVTINSKVWQGKANKTRHYMAEKGIQKADILKVVNKLKIENYSATKEDRNPNFPNELVWEFGITENIVDKEEDLYIKLKIREIAGKKLIIMSFHPEQPMRIEDKLMFPYHD